jgi:predicted DNA-binding transcriptional regulator AlpA
MPSEKVGRILELYRNPSLRIYEIAQLVGRDPSTIYRVIKQAGRAIERRGTGHYPNYRRRYTHRVSAPSPERRSSMSASWACPGLGTC